MSVPLTLLGLLEREPSHGYDLKRDYDTWFGRGKPLPYGQVYATLSRLARDGKAIAGPAEHGEGPDRKRYAITEAGIADVEHWLSEPAPPEVGVVVPLEVVAVARLPLKQPEKRQWNTHTSEYTFRVYGRQGGSEKEWSGPGLPGRLPGLVVVHDDVGVIGRAGRVEVELLGR